MKHFIVWAVRIPFQFTNAIHRDRVLKRSSNSLGIPCVFNNHRVQSAHA